MHNYDEVNHLCCGTMPCWKSDQAVGNLHIDDENFVIVWEKDGSVFSKIDG